MPLTLLIAPVCINRGADALVRAGPPGPAFSSINDLDLPRQADEGVGRGPGGPPHNLCRIVCQVKVSGIGLKPVSAELRPGVVGSFQNGEFRVFRARPLRPGDQNRRDGAGSHLFLQNRALSECPTIRPLSRTLCAPLLLGGVFSIDPKRGCCRTKPMAKRENATDQRSDRRVLVGDSITKACTGRPDGAFQLLAIIIFRPSQDGDACDSVA